MSTSISNKKWRGIVTADGQDVAAAFVFVFVVIAERTVFIVVCIVSSPYQSNRSLVP